MWKAILIDDEEIGLDVLDIMLGETGQVNVIGKYQLVQEAIAVCGELQPELIFLDIEMPGISGLDAAVQLSAQCPDASIIFVTAHEQYAVDAFHTDAIGYLLKPVARAKLERTLERYAAQRKKQALQAPATSVPESVMIEHNNKEVEGVSSSLSILPVLSLRMMGSLQVNTADGQLLSWRTRKTKELFAFLWHHQGKPVYKFSILEELWGEVSAQQGQKLLHTSLYYMRTLFKTLGYEDVVKYGDERYWIDPAIFRVDLAQLLELMAQQVTASDVQQAIALYSGDYLETEHYAWAESYRIELRTVMTTYLSQSLPQLASADRIAALYKLIELEPYRESHYEQLIALLKGTNDVAGARRIEEWKQRVWAEDGQ